MKNVKVILIAISIAAFGQLQAQYTGPGGDKEYTAQEVKDNAKELDKSDALVKLNGKIVERISEDSFWFEDDSGRIMIEIEDDEFPDRQFDETSQVTILGEVDHDMLEEAEVEVEQVV